MLFKGHDCIGRKLHHHHYTDEETLDDAATDEETISCSENCHSTVGDNHPLLCPYPKQPTGLIVYTPSESTTRAAPAPSLAHPSGSNTSIPPLFLAKPFDQAAGAESDDEVLALDDLEAADIRRAIELSLTVCLIFCN